MLTINELHDLKDFTYRELRDIKETGESDNGTPADVRCDELATLFKKLEVLCLENSNI